MNLSGNHPQLGQVHLQLNPAFQSFGQINNVIQTPTGGFASGDSQFGVFVRLDLPNLGGGAFNPVPVDVRAPGITRLDPPQQPHASGPTSVPLIFDDGVTEGTIIDVIHFPDPVCIYQVTCIDGPCNDCGVSLGDVCTGARCPGGTCSVSVQTTCGASPCCVVWSLIGCEPSSAPPCPFGPNACPACDPTPGACCLPDGSCIVTTEAECKQQAGPAAYQGDGTTCSQPEACCFPDGSCRDLAPECCVKIGGTPDGPGACIPPEKCCLPNGTCINADPACCVNILGGTPFAGACEPVEACCFQDGTCTQLEPSCCIDAGGTPDGIGPCFPREACCFPDGTCIMADPFCCPDLGGVARGAGTTCATPNICLGACCHGDGTCTHTTENACNGANDTFKGIGTNCADFRPTITMHPADARICVDDMAVFTVAATGNGTLHYQWTKNGANVGGDSNTLTLNNVPLADHGASIVCKVSDDCGMRTSNAATLTVRESTANTPFVAANAALNGPVAASNPLGANTYGLTFPESVTVTISADCSSGQWCAVVTGITGNYSMQTRLLPPNQMEVTGPGPGGNTTQANFCAQATELSALGFPAATAMWYMLSAVVAHENVHLTRFEPALEQRAGVIEASFEALCVPFTGQTRAEAIVEIKALEAYATAVTDAQTTWFNRVITLVANDHNAGGPTDTAEHAVVDPMVASICTAADNSCWGPCAACPARTRGACCTGAACTCTLPADCAGPGQVFQGVGTTCSPNPCP